MHKTKNPDRLPMERWGWSPSLQPALYHYFVSSGSTYCNVPTKPRAGTTLHLPKGSRPCEHCLALNPLDLQLGIAHVA